MDGGRADPPRRVRCGECGLLTQVDGSEMKEVRLHERETGQIGHSTYPRCSLGRPSFSVVETAGHAGDAARHGNVLHALTVRHECGHFVEYVPLHSPKEHMEMKYAESIRAESDRRDREMRDWQAEQARLAVKRDEDKERRENTRDDAKRTSDREWQDEQRRATISANRTNAILAVMVGAIVALIFSFLKPDKPPVINNIIAPPAAATSTP